MAFWHRIRNSKLKTACFQFSRCYTHLPHSSLSNSIPKTPPILMPYSHSLFHDKPSIVFNSVRFFAVPVQFQVKPKNDEDDSDGPRLNDQIKAKFIRLVMDDGHSVVSRFEALECARKLKFDLVEVDKNAKPPVCKIMDFHKEMYKKKESDKERAKSKSEMTMRKECKEVRFSEKTESKDIKMKSDMVRKLMEKGYRVKFQQHLLTNLYKGAMFEKHNFLSTTASNNTAEGGSEEKEKISVTFVDKDGEEQLIKVPIGMSMLEAAHENDIELEGACEGSLACSTCHVIVMDVEYYNKLEDPTDEENDMLDLAFGLCETSRLGCQVIAKPELDGVRLALPAATRNFAVDGYVPKPH